MGRRNTSGILAKCNHCGYTWYYTGNKETTSCPNCSWRVRIRPSKKKALVAGRALRTSRPREPLI